jgi:hypothetical protein
VGIDPDVAVIEPEPPGWKDLRSLKLWEPGCRAPRLAIEVVSPSHPYKDYSALPERYAALGPGELWVVDPGRFGPQRLGGPHFMQQWEREDDGALVRRYAGDGPVHSEYLDAWLHSDPERGVVLCSDAAGKHRWLAPEEENAERVEHLAARLRELGVDPTV